MKSTRYTNIVLSKKVHVLVFYPLLNWKMYGVTMENVEHSLLLTDAHNVKKRRVIKTF